MENWKERNRSAWLKLSVLKIGLTLHSQRDLFYFYLVKN